MLKELFIGHRPSHFHLNPIVKAFIISETFIWASWNFFTPIFAIFASTTIAGGNTEIAASSFSSYLMARVLFELVSGKFLMKSDEFQKFIVAIIGIIILSITYIGYASTHTIVQLYVFSIMSGLGLGISTPAKNALFSTHLDKNKEAAEWGIYDATAFMGMALAATLGGFIANKYGFQFLFLLAAMINFLGIIPYLLILNKPTK